jgi:FkbM family methyltransferase
MRTGFEERILTVPGYKMHRLINSLDNAVPGACKRLLRRTTPQFFDWYYRRLARLAPEGLVEITIQSGPLAGRRFNCNMKDGRAYFVGNYDSVVLEAIKPHIEPGSVVYDIGAHYGYFKLVFAELTGKQGHVFAFEPSPETFDAVRRNVELNSDLASRISLVSYAVSDRTGSDQLLTFNGSYMSGLARTAPADCSNLTHSSSSVDSVTIDDFVAQGNLAPTFIKMDIEGAEEFAFQGARALIRTIRPKILVEVHHLSARSAIHSMFEEMNYSTIQVGEQISSSEPRPWIDGHQAHYLLLPK